MRQPGGQSGNPGSPKESSTLCEKIMVGDVDGAPEDLDETPTPHHTKQAVNSTCIISSGVSCSGSKEADVLYPQIQPEGLVC